MIIEDTLFNPYYIEIEPDNTIVYRDCVSAKGKERKDIFGYFSSVKQAINKIQRLKSADNMETHSLDSYLKQLVDENEKFNNILKIFS